MDCHSNTKRTKRFRVVIHEHNNLIKDLTLSEDDFLYNDGK